MADVSALLESLRQCVSDTEYYPMSPTYGSMDYTETNPYNTVNNTRTAPPTVAQPVARLEDLLHKWQKAYRKLEDERNYWYAERNRWRMKCQQLMELNDGH